MEISYPPAFIPALKNKFLLLDTNIFRDATSKPSMFNSFFNELKQAEVSIATINPVKYELLKGSANATKYQVKEKFINDIIDICIPTIPKTYDLVYELIQKYNVDGKGVDLTDLFLGAMLMQYKTNIYLMTRDTTDFPQNIFDLAFIINASHTKGIFTYGIYQYNK